MSDQVFVDFESLDINDQNLIKSAVAAREKSFSPISHFKVGAALRTTDNVVVSGCNVESYAFSPTICAERTAVCKGVSEGHLRFNTVVVAAYLENSYTYPCGVCRQVLGEFCEDNTIVYLTKPDMKQIVRTTLDKLLPFAFKSYT